MIIGRYAEAPWNPVKELKDNLFSRYAVLAKSAVESGEGIESTPNLRRPGIFFVCVESGEGIESMKVSVQRILREKWNPVKELKVFSPPLNSFKIGIPVESGEGIERSSSGSGGILCVEGRGIR